MGKDSCLPLKKSGQSVVDRNLPYRFLRGQPLNDNIRVNENKQTSPTCVWQLRPKALECNNWGWLIACILSGYVLSDYFMNKERANWVLNWKIFNIGIKLLRLTAGCLVAARHMSHSPENVVLHLALLQQSTAISVFRLRDS